MGTKQKVPLSNSFVHKLLREHGTLRRVLGLIQEQVHRIEQGEVPDMALFGNALYYLRKFPSVFHHPLEDALFDRLLPKASHLKPEIDSLREQHREIYELENWLSETALEAAKLGPAAYPRLVEFARRYLVLQWQHGETEEQVIFPAALKALGPADWLALGTRMAEASDPLAGGPVPERFRRLYDYLEHKAKPAA
ncbi:MAG: hemerythrin domain-containing protein [Bacillota bacterium]